MRKPLVPAFIIEELGDGRFTVFVPLNSDTAGGVHPDGGAGASALRTVYAGDQYDFAVGIRLEGSGTCKWRAEEWR